MMNTNVLEAVADILDYADSILEAEGYEVNESIDDPDQFLGVLADMFEDDEVEFSDEALEALGEVGDALLESLDIDLTEGEQELSERGAMSTLHKKLRRMKERDPETGGKTAWTKPGHRKDVEAERDAEIEPYDLTGKEAAAERSKKGVEALKQRLLARKQGKPAEVKPIHKAEPEKKPEPAKAAEPEKKPEPAKAAEPEEKSDAEKERESMARVAADRAAARNREARAKLGLKGLLARQAIGHTAKAGDKPEPEPVNQETGKKQRQIHAGGKASNESLELEVEQQLVRMAEMVEAAGYSIEEDLSVCEFLEAVGIILDGNTLAEGVASEIAEGLKKVKGRCGCGCPAEKAVDESKGLAMKARGHTDPHVETGPVERRWRKRQASRFERRSAKAGLKAGKDLPKKSGFGGYSD